MTYRRAVSLCPFSRFVLTNLSTFDRLLFLGFQLPRYSQRFFDYIVLIHLLLLLIVAIIAVIRIHKPI